MVCSGFQGQTGKIHFWIYDPEGQLVTRVQPGVQLSTRLDPTGLLRFYDLNSENPRPLGP